MPNNDPAMTGIWGELNKVLGGLDLNNDSINGHSDNGLKARENSNSALNGGSQNGQPNFLSIGSRSSLDLGTLGRSENSTGVPVSSSPTSSSSMINTANMGRQLSLPTDPQTSSLPAFGGIRSNGINIANSANEIGQTSEMASTKDESSPSSASEVNE